MEVPYCRVRGFAGYQECSRTADVGELEVVWSGAEYDCWFSRGYEAWTKRRQAGGVEDAYVFSSISSARAHSTCLLFYGKRVKRSTAVTVASDLARPSSDNQLSVGQHQHYKHHHRLTTAVACRSVCALHTLPRYPTQHPRQQRRLRDSAPWYARPHVIRRGVHTDIVQGNQQSSAGGGGPPDDKSKKDKVRSVAALAAAVCIRTAVSL